MLRTMFQRKGYVININIKQLNRFRGLDLGRHAPTIGHRLVDRCLFASQIVQYLYNYLVTLSFQNNVNLMLDVVCWLRIMRAFAWR